MQINPQSEIPDLVHSDLLVKDFSWGKSVCLNQEAPLPSLKPTLVQSSKWERGGGVGENYLL